MECWAAPTHAKVLGSYGFREIEPDAAETVMDDDVPSSIFHTKQKEPSIPQLADVINRTTWVTMSPQASHNLAAEQHMMLEAHKNGKVDLPAMAWRTAFVRRGMLVELQVDGKGQKKVFVSLGAWPDGSATLLLPLERKTVDRMKLWCVPPNIRKVDLNWLFLKDFRDVQVVQARPVSPQHLGLASTTKRIPDYLGHWLDLEKRRQPVLEAMALVAFDDIGVNLLERLFHETWLG
jgi:hypothetical protein